jgi:hypothetical protein
MVRSTQTVHQSCIKSSTIPKRTEPSFHLSLITKKSHPVRPIRFLCLWYVHCKPCTYLASRLTLTPSLNDRNEIPDDQHHLRVPSSASKMISDPMVRSAQTMHLSCIKISTMSKRTETSFHLNLVT